MSGLYIIAGINHFIHPEVYKKIMPHWLGWHHTLISVSGICEILFGFNELVKEVIDDMQKTSATHEINYTVDKDGKIFGARDKIGQVLNNLISNAIKYSPSSKTINIFD
jgi:two-component sensor histidine kinase